VKSFILAKILVMKNYTLFKQPSDIKLELANRLKQIRKQKGYTQQELSLRSNVSLGSLKRFEQNGEISLHHLLSLSQILGVLDDFNFLFDSKKDEISDKVKKAFEND
jgi:transcriptional regulator with XRE-family HTH domain